MSRYYMVRTNEEFLERPDVLLPGLSWWKGQLEVGEENGYRHWQMVICCEKRQRSSFVRKLFPRAGYVMETKSEAANDYVHKDNTCADVATRFELGKLPKKRNSTTDWDQIRASAQAGDFSEIPSDIYVRNYRTLKAIEKDHMAPVAMERQVYVYWGKAGSGKSKKAWEEAGLDAYPKGPTSIYWDGYRGEPNVVMDEFRGLIDVSHMLRWLDRYPVCVEQKFGGCVFKASKIWITSNLHPKDWYPNLDEETKAALLRRLTITHFSNFLINGNY